MVKFIEKNILLGNYDLCRNLGAAILYTLLYLYTMPHFVQRL